MANRPVNVFAKPRKSKIQLDRKLFFNFFFDFLNFFCLFSSFSRLFRGAEARFSPFFGGGGGLFFGFKRSATA